MDLVEEEIEQRGIGHEERRLLHRHPTGGARGAKGIGVLPRRGEEKLLAPLETGGKEAHAGRWNIRGRERRHLKDRRGAGIAHRGDGRRHVRRERFFRFDRRPIPARLDVRHGHERAGKRRPPEESRPPSAGDTRHEDARLPPLERRVPEIVPWHGDDDDLGTKPGKVPAQRAQHLLRGERRNAAIDHGDPPARTPQEASELRRKIPALRDEPAEGRRIARAENGEAVDDVGRQGIAAKPRAVHPVEAVAVAGYQAEAQLGVRLHELPTGDERRRKEARRRRAPKTRDTLERQHGSEHAQQAEG
jgi:hypothetical protein